MRETSWAQVHKDVTRAVISSVAFQQQHSTTKLLHLIFLLLRTDEHNVPQIRNPTNIQYLEFISEAIFKRSCCPSDILVWAPIELDLSALQERYNKIDRGNTDLVLVQLRGAIAPSTLHHLPKFALQLPTTTPRSMSCVRTPLRNLGSSLSFKLKHYRIRSFSHWPIRPRLVGISTWIPQIGDRSPGECSERCKYPGGQIRLFNFAVHAKNATRDIDNTEQCSTWYPVPTTPFLKLTRSGCTRRTNHGFNGWGKHFGSSIHSQWDTAGGRWTARTSATHLGRVRLWFIYNARR